MKTSVSARRTARLREPDDDRHQLVVDALKRAVDAVERTRFGSEAYGAALSAVATVARRHAAIFEAEPTIQAIAAVDIRWPAVVTAINESPAGAVRKARVAGAFRVVVETVQDFAMPDVGAFALSRHDHAFIEQAVRESFSPRRVLAFILLRTGRRSGLGPQSTVDAASTKHLDERLKKQEDRYTKYRNEA